MQFLNGCKANIDIVDIDPFKILNRRNAQTAIADIDFLIEKIFDRCRIKKIVFCLFDDVGGIYKEQEVAITLLIKIKDQPRHDECFTASGCHVEQEMQGICFAFVIGFVTTEEARKGFDLIIA